MHVLETCCLMEYPGRCLLPYSCASVRACSRSGKLLEGLRLSALPPMVHEVSPMLLRCLFQQSSQAQCANGATGLHCVTGLMLLASGLSCTSEPLATLSPVVVMYACTRKWPSSVFLPCLNGCACFALHAPMTCWSSHCWLLWGMSSVLLLKFR